MYVVKLDGNGNVQWTRTIGGPEDDEGSSIVRTVDGGYAVAGWTWSFGAGYWDVYVVKLDKAGRLNVGSCGTTSMGGESVVDLESPTVGRGGRVSSPTPSVGSGGRIGSGGTVKVCAPFSK
ncbi:MAG: hypothetical protein D6750_03490 [Bacteroidetes bacterium]|nr:MAG: hypothetical protein D6750_03490 [Bacteroidota bacterium]